MPQANSRTTATFARHVAPFAPLAMALLMSNVSPTENGARLDKTMEQTAAGESGFAQSCDDPRFPTETPAALDETPCGISGNGGAETWQNDAKNNFCPIGVAKPITIAEMLQLQLQVQQDQSIPFGNPRKHPLTSNPGPAKNRAPLERLGEGNQVVLVGFVRIARQEGAESVNCGLHVPNEADDHDIHISIVQNTGDAECSGVVVEMTPHHRPPEWTPKNVQDVSAAQLLVRVTGQLMFDSSHSPCVNGVSAPGDPARASLWEVHPIYKFEVCNERDCSSGAGWVPLEAWKKT